MSLKEFFVSRRDEIIIWACGFVYGSFMFVWLFLMIGLAFSFALLAIAAEYPSSFSNFVPMP